MLLVIYFESNASKVCGKDEPENWNSFLFGYGHKIENRLFLAERGLVTFTVYRETGHFSEEKHQDGKKLGPK